ncbi:hypothetical protein KC331_g4708 [Hortaea werneckii]|nr:hypothetical protein KC331_g4708 [Hortaea werneckii]KAI7717785.1 hypothetical protein KC353_g4318 [Hortaea werneckii]
MRNPLSGCPGAEASSSASSTPRAPRKRAPDTVDSCPGADTSSFTTNEPGPFEKKSKRPQVECESPTEASNDPPREQLTEVPHEQSDETRKEQDRLPPELASFVRSDGYLDHGRITQPVRANCIFARCSGAASWLPGLVTHMMATYDVARWPDAPVSVNRQSKSLCTAELSDRAVCPFAASNGMCTNRD